jgi:hypothetical protein
MPAAPLITRLGALSQALAAIQLFAALPCDRLRQVTTGLALPTVRFFYDLNCGRDSLFAAFSGETALCAGSDNLSCSPDIRTVLLS